MSDIFETILFDYKTTNRTDFRLGQIKPLVATLVTPKPTRRRLKPTILKDIHTLTPLHNTIPFDLFIKAKDVVRTNPRRVQQAYAKPPDLQREQVQKTRPRLVMTPAVTLDDGISQPEREFLVKDIYTTTKQRIQGVSLPPNEQAPFPGQPAPANPITLRTWRPPYVSPEWRMESARWDGRQLRAHCDPDREFYLARTHKCDVCEVSARLSHRK